jgi:iron complex outermembrane recepter protein
MKQQIVALALCSAGLLAQALAQDAPSRNEDDASQPLEVIVTGSRIKQDPTNSPLPLQVVTAEELTREGIKSPEQLISFLTSNGTGLDNLASNADVVGGIVG